jgi:tetratricopeptide (TPR) repeat protein
MRQRSIASVFVSLLACGSPQSAPVAPASPAPPPPMATAPPGADDDPHALCASPSSPTVNRALLLRRPALARDIGRVRQVATTSSREAFDYYEQGMAYLHSYAWIEAARSFNHALRLDPEFVMAWVGLSRTESGMLYSAEANAAAKKAAALAARAGNRLGGTERRLAELRVMQLDAIAAPASKEKAAHLAYKLAIEKAIAADPQDAELWILRGQAEEAGAWGRGQGGGVGAIAFFEAALAREPRHFGANHYLTHAYENVGRHAEAEKHGRIYATAASRIGHAHHMHGHILPRLGRWEEALARFERTDKLEVEYTRAEKLEPGDDWHHAHNLVLLGYTYLRLGRPRDAEATFRRMVATPIWSPGQVAFRGALPELLLLQGKPAEALEATRVLIAHSFAGSRAVGRALEAEALLLLDRPGDAHEAVRAAQAELARARKVDGLTRRYVEMLSTPAVEAAAAIALLHGGDARRAETAVIAIADRLSTNPRFDAWGEGLFRLERMVQHARAAGRAALAGEVRERMAKIDPAYQPGAWNR